MAEKGAGSTLDGGPVRLAHAATLKSMQGFAGWGFLRRLAADPQRKSMLDKLGRLGSLNCAGLEYIHLLRGERQFSIYRWTRPWDHAAGALMMREANGVAVRFDGGPYIANQASDAGIITAPDLATSERLRELLVAPPAPLLDAAQSR